MDSNDDDDFIRSDPTLSSHTQLTMNLLNNLLQMQGLEQSTTTATPPSPTPPYNSQLLLEQQIKLTQLQQLQQLQNQIFQQQIALISGQSSSTLGNYMEPLPNALKLPSSPSHSRHSSLNIQQQQRSEHHHPHHQVRYPTSSQDLPPPSPSSSTSTAPVSGYSTAATSPNISHSHKHRDTQYFTQQHPFSIPASSSSISPGSHSAPERIAFNVYTGHTGSISIGSPLPSSQSIANGNIQTTGNNTSRSWKPYNNTNKSISSSPSLPILDQDISPLTSPWLGARPTSGAGCSPITSSRPTTTNNKRSASASDDDEGPSPRKKQSPAIRPTLTMTEIHSTTTTTRELGRKGDKSASTPTPPPSDGSPPMQGSKSTTSTPGPITLTRIRSRTSTTSRLVDGAGTTTTIGGGGTGLGDDSSSPDDDDLSMPPPPVPNSNSNPNSASSSSNLSSGNNDNNNSINMEVDMGFGMGMMDMSGMGMDMSGMGHMGMSHMSSMGMNMGLNNMGMDMGMGMSGMDLMNIGMSPFAGMMDYGEGDAHNHAQQQQQHQQTNPPPPPLPPPPLVPVTPASIMNLGRLGINSSTGSVSQGSGRLTASTAPSHFTNTNSAPTPTPTPAHTTRQTRRKESNAGSSSSTKTGGGVSTRSNARSSRKNTTTSLISPNLKPLLPAGSLTNHLDPSSPMIVSTTLVSASVPNTPMTLLPTPGSSSGGGGGNHHQYYNGNGANTSQPQPQPQQSQQQQQPIQVRKTSHKAAEQKRRDSLKTTFDDLRKLLPPILLPNDSLSPSLDPSTPSTSHHHHPSGSTSPSSPIFLATAPLLPGSLPPRGPPKAGGEGPNKGVSKLQLLICGNEFIRVLKARVERRDEEIERLRKEVARLRGLVVETEGEAEVVGRRMNMNASRSKVLPCSMGRIDEDGEQPGKGEELDLERDLDAVERERVPPSVGSVHLRTGNGSVGRGRTGGGDDLMDEGDDEGDDEVDD